MNIRIKELWSQAGGHYNSGNQHTWPQYTIDDPEKFAELIVKACVAFIDSHDQLDKYGDPYEMVYGKDVLKHFGVKE